ncbi:MAG: hypothetical protein RIQ89_1869 [Bacteroidota bacterium]
MKVDLLVFGAHPDDAELGCGGTILKHLAMGKKVAIVDLTEGELGTRGSAKTRYEEAARSSAILGLTARINLKMQDGFFEVDHANLLKIVDAVRTFQPAIVCANAISDRHPDHGRAATLVSRGVFLAGLPKVKSENQSLGAHKVRAVYHFIQDRYIKPDLVIDISEQMEGKMESIKAFKTQFYDPDSSEPETPISSKAFLEFVRARAAEMGRNIHAAYGEGFTVHRPIGINSLFELK